MEEIWKDIPGYEGFYEVSNMGQIKSFHIINGIKNRILKTWLVGYGYQVIRLCKNGKDKQYYVHAIVLEAFVGKRPAGYTCNHINGNKLDNRLENLEYCTQAENNLHSFRVLKRKPVINRGEKSGCTKLTKEKVFEIRQSYETKKYTMKEMESLFNVSDSTIFNVIHKKVWRHI